MYFSENLKRIRKERRITQEQLAELLNVSRQAVSKWESGDGYPETDKLISLSKILNISIDELLTDAEPFIEKKEECYHGGRFENGQLSIVTYDRESIVLCRGVKTSKILLPQKNEPRYILMGVDRVTFWGEHTTTLGWYASLEDIRMEIQAISEAMTQGLKQYELKYFADVELIGILGQPRIKK